LFTVIELLAAIQVRQYGGAGLPKTRDGPAGWRWRRGAQSFAVSKFLLLKVALERARHSKGPCRLNHGTTATDRGGLPSAALAEIGFAAVPGGHRHNGE